MTDYALCKPGPVSNTCTKHATCKRRLIEPGTWPIYLASTPVGTDGQCSHYDPVPSKPDPESV